MKIEDCHTVESLLRFYGYSEVLQQIANVCDSVGEYEYDRIASALRLVDQYLTHGRPRDEVVWVRRA